MQFFVRSLVLFIFVFLFIPFSKAFASEYFDTSYYVTYTVREDGTTQARMQISLKNKSDSYFASKNKISVGFDEISNVKISDPGGSIEPSVTKTEEGHIIESIFNSKVVGEGEVLKYTISFDTKDIARNEGRIWEINIPGLSSDSDFSEFTVDVRVPNSFGKPTFIKPSQSSDKTIFTKEELGESGISISYGSSQIYEFNLFYHLKNTNVFPVRTEIALPPTTNYQDIYLEYINPKPVNVIKDNDGNWLAQYKLLPSQSMTVQARGKAVLSLFPKQEFLSSADRKKYLQPKPYWEADNKEIKDLASRLKTPRAIYDYLVENLSYDFSRVENNSPRLGAYKTFKNPKSAVCLEFTDLFIALARASGIPAREVDGYAHTQNSRERPLSLVNDILHAWPEYYDDQKKTWIMVDPTWGNTTGGVDYFDVLDFDHFAFVKRGLDSQYPIPAGGYKYEEDKKLKDVNISFPKSFSEDLPKVSLEQNKNEFLSFLPIQTGITIKNTGTQIVPAQVVAVKSSELMPRKNTYKIESIPPFGSVVVPVEFEKTELMTKGEFGFSISVALQEISLKIKIIPIIFSYYAIVAGGILIGILTITIFIYTKKTRRI